MTITIEKYNQATEVLAKNDWASTDNAYYVQFLSADYTFSATQTAFSSVDSYLIGDPVLLTGRSISDAGIFTAAILQASAAATAVQSMVVYLQNAETQSPFDQLIFLASFDEPTDLATSDEIDFGIILTL